jgi:hypothetical protein
MDPMSASALYVKRTLLGISAELFVKSAAERKMNIFDVMMEDYKPTLKDKIVGRFERALSDKYFDAKWFVQKAYRKNHASDCDVWNLYHHLAEVITPKLIAFRNSEIHGHPCAFSNPEDIPGYEDFSDKEKAGYVGGGHEAWIKVIDEMIYAFEHTLYYDSDYTKKGIELKKIFLKKYGYADPALTTEKKHELHSFVYRSKETDNLMTSNNPNEDKEKWDYKGEDVSFFDYKLEQEMSERVAKGFELFGKYFRSLWD